MADRLGSDGTVREVFFSKSWSTLIGFGFLGGSQRFFCRHFRFHLFISELCTNDTQTKNTWYFWIYIFFVIYVKIGTTLRMKNNEQYKNSRSSVNMKISHSGVIKKNVQKHSKYSWTKCWVRTSWGYVLLISFAFKSSIYLQIVCTDVLFTKREVKMAGY